MHNQTVPESIPSVVAEAAARRRFRPNVARETRIAAGVSLSRMAEALGVSPVTVQRWETGKRVPRPALLVHYLDLLDLIGADR